MVLFLTALSRPFGHLAKPRFDYNEFEETDQHRYRLLQDVQAATSEQTVSIAICFCDYSFQTCCLTCSAPKNA